MSRGIEYLSIVFVHHYIVRAKQSMDNTLNRSMQNQTFRCKGQGIGFRTVNFSANSFAGKVALCALFLSLFVLHVQTGTAQQKDWPEYTSLDSAYTAEDSTVVVLHRAINADSSMLESWRALLDIQKRRGDFEQELHLASKMAAANPDEPRAFYALGDAQLNNGMVVEAIVSLRQALSLEPRYVRALTTIAEAYDMAFIRDTALMYLDSAVRCNPRNAQGHFQRAELLTRMGRRLEAIDSYRAWANLQPFVAEPWIKLGEAQSLIGEYREAITTLEYALSLKEDSPDALFQIAVAKQGIGETVEAKTAFRDFFFRFPRHERAQEAEERARALGWDPAGN